MSAPLRLRLDRDALVHNWRWFSAASGAAACGAAVKADGYGLGAIEVVATLARAGCRDFFVATYWEAEALGALPDGCALSVLHGPQQADMSEAVASPARPVLNTPEQVVRWRGTGRSCDVMVDTGMNRLGLRPEQVGLVADLPIDTLMSHLSCADENRPTNERQRRDFEALDMSAERRSLANSAGILLGADYHYDLTRPGLGLYGGVPRDEATGKLRQVAWPEAQIVQRRRVPVGESIGYGGTFTAERTVEVAVLNIGYADGYLRGFSSRGSAGEGRFPVLGRVSMDLVAIDVSAEAALREGDWVAIDYDLPTASAQSGLSQYELLTGLAGRYQREWG